MDYEKKYKEALEWMRDLYPTMEGFVKEDAEHFFPELQQEQPEVDLEKEITRWLCEGEITDINFDDYDDADIERTARHFYKLGLNARKEE